MKKRATRASSSSPTITRAIARGTSLRPPPPDPAGPGQVGEGDARAPAEAEGTAAVGDGDGGGDGAAVPEGLVVTPVTMGLEQGDGSTCGKLPTTPGALTARGGQSRLPWGKRPASGEPGGCAWVSRPC